MIAASAIGVSMMRLLPNSVNMLRVIAYVPPQTPTSSPRIRTRSSRIISSRKASRTASRYVFWDMAPLLRDQDIAAQLGRLGRGAGFGELHRGVGFGVRFVRDRLQLRFRSQPAFQDGAAPEQDRVPRLRRFDFLLGAIALRVAHRVTAEA